MRTFKHKWQKYLPARCCSCQPTSSVKTPKGTGSTDPKQGRSPTGLICSKPQVHCNKCFLHCN